MIDCVWACMITGLSIVSIYIYYTEFEKMHDIYVWQIFIGFAHLRKIFTPLLLFYAVVKKYFCSS